MANDSTFVDTNILIYSTFEHFAEHATAKAKLRNLARNGMNLWINRQVLREFLQATTRPDFLQPLPPMTYLVERIRDFQSYLRLAEEDERVTEYLLQLAMTPGARGRQIHDANIVAVMLRHEIRNLLTHNTADFKRYEPSITVMPLMD